MRKRNSENDKREIEFFGSKLTNPKEIVCMCVCVRVCVCKGRSENYQWEIKVKKFWEERNMVKIR